MSFLRPEYVDPAVPLSGPERRGIVREAWRLWLARPLNLLIYVATLVPLNALIIVVRVVLEHVRGTRAIWHSFVGLAVQVAALLVALLLLQRVFFTPLVRRLVRAAGYDVCLRCGHWLRGLGPDVARCPECGAERPAEPPET